MHVSLWMLIANFEDEVVKWFVDEDLETWNGSNTHFCLLRKFLFEKRKRTKIITFHHILLRRTYHRTLNILSRQLFIDINFLSSVIYQIFYFAQISRIVIQHSLSSFKKSCSERLINVTIINVGGKKFQQIIEFNNHVVLSKS